MQSIFISEIFKILYLYLRNVFGYFLKSFHLDIRLKKSWLFKMILSKYPIVLA